MTLGDKEIVNYFLGKGLDTSSTPTSWLKGIANVVWKYKEPNNFYHFYEKEGIKYESFDFVFNQNVLNKTKFYKILIKEWFYLIRPGGSLIIKFKEDNQFSTEKWMEIFSVLINDKGEILYFKKNDGYFTVVIQKWRSCLSQEDSIEKWSFCIISWPQHDIKQLIHSIASQNIPHCEIITLVPFSFDFPTHNLEFKCLNFLKDYPSSIIKNKFLVSAKYENVVVIDRRKANIILDKNFFVGLKRYGNYFDALSCVLTASEGERYADWWTLACYKKNLSKNLFKTSMLGILDYKDWDDWVYFPDPIFILKKNLSKKVLWGLDCNEGDENTLFSHQLLLKGAILRLNPFTKAIVNNPYPEFFAKNFPKFEFNRVKLGRRRKKLLRRLAWIIMEVIFKIKILEKILSSIIKKIKHTRIYEILLK